MYKKTIIFFIVLFHAYYGYRYALQYNSSTTSPTYSDTPFMWQIGKYVLMMLCVAFSLFFVWLKKEQVPMFKGATPLLAALGLLGALFSVFAVLQFSRSADIGDAVFLKAGLAVPVGVAIASGCRTRFDQESIIKWVAIFPLVYHLIYEFVQIALFWFIGRLPALGYEGIISRFGGGWDDPNGFGVYLSLPFTILTISIFRAKERRIASGLIVFLILICIFLTYSYSALISLALSVVALAWLLRIYFVAAISALLAAVLPFVVGDSLFDIQEFTERKSGSALSRVTQFSDAYELVFGSLNSFLFGAGDGAFQSENIYLSVLLNYGIFVLLVFLFTILVSTVVVYRSFMFSANQGGAGYNSRFHVGSFIFCMIFPVIGNFIPVFYLFPINIFYWALVFLFLLDRRRLVANNDEGGRSRRALGKKLLLNRVAGFPEAR